MKYFRGTTRGVLRIVFLTLLPILTAMADEKFVKSQEPVFPAVQPDRALVYIVRPEGTAQLFESSTLSVFLDDKPVGFLPRHSYLAVQVQPGRRLLWGPMHRDSAWYEFDAGKTYLLLLVERNVGRYEERAWGSGDPTDVRILVAGKKLSYVTQTEEGIAKLREEVAKEYDKVRKNAPTAAAATLPSTFQTVWYRPGKRGFSFKAYDATGTLTVEKDKIEFRSDKKTLVIPVKDIQAVSLDKITSKFMSQFDPNEWGIVKYSSSGSTEVAAFRDGHNLGHGGDTERIYLTLRFAVQPAPRSEASGAANQSFREQPKQEGAAPEEQVVVTSDQRKWHVGYETEKGGQRIKEFVLPEETLDNWTELVTVQSFPGAEKRMTAKEAALRMKQQLNECPNAMWRIIQGGDDELLYEWQTVDCPGWDNQYEVSKLVRGQTAIHRVAYANRKLPIAEETRRQWSDLIGKAGFQTLGPAAQSTPTPSPPQSVPSPSSAQPKTANILPEGFVLYEGLKGQFTIRIPEGWMAYDQSQALKGVPGRFGMVFFLPSKDFASQFAGGRAFMSPEVMHKVDSGEIASFFVEREAADKGMSCTGFSEKAEKKLVDLIGKDPVIRGKNALEPAHAEPAVVGGCKGLRIRAKGQPSPGTPWVADAYMASDGETLYIFSLRNLAENYEKNADIFQKAVSTAKLSAPK